MADNQIGAAIAAIHAEPARPWTLPELARHVGMSRTTFAVRFKRKVGLSPIDYLIRWRMLLAGDRLSNTRQSIAAIASSLGYETESAFGAAFKRTMGCSPRQYSRSDKRSGLAVAEGA
ncbi:helix-turn-helix domain-containing protein [Sphingomonas fennica]|uniref:helix-turn-helix domain-containing protein n=1 Tax=Edaphosphingomonas fennica TaxID=114404 RepID=UPI001B87AF97|nr:helix-turn-helix transcriptional regulator [Sphingomonas fennica]